MASTSGAAGFVASAAAPAAPADSSTLAVEIVKVDGFIDSISPDGRWLAGTADNTPCMWPLDTLAPVCADERIPVYSDGPFTVMTWAPDSSAVSFGEDLVRRFYEPDVYVFTTAGELANLTDDGIVGGLLSGRDGDGEPLVDLASTWSHDSTTLYFARTVYGDDGAASSTTLMSVAAAGGEATELAAGPIPAPFAVWAPMHEAVDGSLLFAVDPGPPGADHGIWRLAAGAAEAELVHADDLSDSPTALVAQRISGMTPAGDLAFVYNRGLLAAQATASPEDAFWKLDVASGKITLADWLDLDRGVAVAAPAARPADGSSPSLASPVGPQAFSPDGTRWVGAFQRVDTAERLFAVIDTESSTVLGTVAAAADERLRFGAAEPQVTDDGTVAVHVGLDSVALLRLAAAV